MSFEGLIEDARAARAAVWCAGRVEWAEGTTGSGTALHYTSCSYPRSRSKFAKVWLTCWDSSCVHCGGAAGTEVMRTGRSAERGAVEAGGDEVVR